LETVIGALHGRIFYSHCATTAISTRDHAVSGKAAGCRIRETVIPLRTGKDRRCRIRQHTSGQNVARWVIASKARQAYRAAAANEVFRESSHVMHETNFHAKESEQSIGASERNFPRKHRAGARYDDAQRRDARLVLERFTGVKSQAATPY